MSNEYRTLEAQAYKIKERRNRTHQIVVDMESALAHLKDVIKDADTDLLALELQLDALRQGGDRANLNGENDD